MQTSYLCVFYSFYNKHACFVTCKNHFLFFTRFKKAHFLEPQSTHVHFCCPIFSNATPFMFLFFVFFSTPYIITIFFFSSFGFSFDFLLIFIILNHFYKAGSIFLTIYFKHFDFIEQFGLNSNTKSLFERSSIIDFLVNSSDFYIDSAM